MTQLATKAFGTIDISPRQVLDFAEGLYGFEEETRFALLDDEQSPFKWLQSMQEPNLAFVLIQPDLFLKTPYVPEVTATELSALNVEKPEECLIFLIVTIPDGQPDQMTANLQGPVLVNAEKKIGRQVISNNDNHAVRVSIMEQLDG